MPQFREPTGVEMLEVNSSHAEDQEEPTCLVCRHYQFRHKAQMIICTERPRIKTPTAGWTHHDAETAITRARRCERFDDMRPTERE